MKPTVTLDLLFGEHPALGKYLRFIATVVNSLGSSKFEKNFIDLLSKLVPIDHCAVFTYSDKGQAGHLFTHSRMPDRVAEKLARDYVEKYHREDPNFASMKKIKDKDYYQFNRQDLKAGNNPAYHNHFFDRSGLIDKASSIGQVKNGKVYCNFYRMSDSQTYSDDDLKLLDDLMPLATALVAAHFELARFRGAAFMDNGSDNIVTKSIVHNAISNDVTPFDILTKREREVCERIMLGYTSTGIGLDLDIAPTSVATYRKRAYKKLSISSQNELFALCLRITNS